MLTVISPAKRLDWSDAPGPVTAPDFGDDARELAGYARKLSVGELKRLMQISGGLAQLNRDRFRAFSDAPAADDLRPAAFAFAGDTYTGLDARTLSGPDLDEAQDRLRILSGLYGVLRPRDAIQPYRLEMGSRLKTRRGATLYDFWGDRIAEALNAAAEAADTDVLVNCASQEYFKAVSTRALKPRVVTPAFLEDRFGDVRMVSFFAKRARGAMARFVIENRVRDPEGLRDFATDGYRYDPARSTPDAPVFVRAEAAAA